MLRLARCLVLSVMASGLAFSQADHDVAIPNYVEVSAHLVLEDGSAIQTSPMISLLVPGARETCTDKQWFMDGTIRLLVPPVLIQGVRQTGCYISVQLAGYRAFTGFVEEGSVITLHRIGLNEGSSVSIASLNAPTEARKAYEAGEAASQKHKWPQAEEHFRKAVALYPLYALAWSELGQALEEQRRPQDASDAYTKAREADPHYIKPVVQLAALNSGQQQWNDEIRFSREALKLHAIEYPAAYYYYAEASFHLGDVITAEHFTREALRLDPGGTCPESLVLLGTIFEKQGNSSDAAVEYRNYLEVAPHGKMAADAKNALARLKN